MCPAIDGAISWNSGSYNPDTGLYYKIGQEWCQNMEAQKLPKPADYSGQDYISASFTPIPRARDTTRPMGISTRSTRSPARRPGKSSINIRRWRACFRPRAACCSCPAPTACSTLSMPRPEKSSGRTTTAIGHDGGIITYVANGKQYIAVTTGWGTWVSQNLANLYGEPFKSMPMDGGTLNVYALQ